MAAYRVWLHATLQPILVEADNKEEAGQKAEAIANANAQEGKWEDWYQTQWEAWSTEPIIE